MIYTIDRGNEFIANNKDKIVKFYRAKFHMEPPIGWMNDPNGLIKINDTFHLFYQFYPYDSIWGPMHWGHFISHDLIKYKNTSIALAPDNLDIETGCFSGSAIEIDNKINLVYTAHFENEFLKKENQFLAFSNDEINFNKRPIPLVDLKELDEKIDKNEFRDPTIKKIDGSYYMFVGSKLKSNEGVILVFKGSTIDNLKFDFIIGPYKEFGIMCECPDYFKIDDKDIFIFSSVQLKEEDNNYKNLNSSLYMIGKLDLENKKYDVETFKEIDKGDTFYAPKIIENCNEIIIIGWLEMWGKSIKTHELKHGYSGSFTIPRVLSYKNGFILQKPIDSLFDYVKEDEYIGSNNIISRNSVLDFKMEDDFNLILESINKENNVKLYAKDGYIYLNTIESNNLNPIIRRTDYSYNDCNIQIVLDSSSIEIFIDDGIETISSRIFLESNDYRVIYDGFKNLRVREIDVNENE